MTEMKMSLPNSCLSAYLRPATSLNSARAVNSLFSPFPRKSLILLRINYSRACHTVSLQRVILDREAVCTLQNCLHLSLETNYFVFKIIPQLT